MAVYDLAAGVTDAGLNSLLAGLHAQPDARAHLFKGSLEKSTPLGDAACTFDLQDVPTVRLSGPTEAEWANAHGADPTQPLPDRPERHAITITMTGLKVEAEIAGTTQDTKGSVQAFAVASVTKGTLSLELVAIGVDESQFSMLDKILVNLVVIPEAIQMASKMLGGIALPQVPGVAGFSFSPLVLAVTPEGVVAATSRSDAPGPDVSGFSWPGDAIFVLATFDALNAGAKAMLEPSYEEKDHTGSDAFTAAGKVTASDLSLVFSAAAGRVQIAVDGEFAAYGELSGVGVGVTKAILCPIGAAADAIADPGKWDKVISQFVLVYKPEPLPVIVDAGIDAPKGSPEAQKITFQADANALPGDLSLLVKPEWSGSVTGSVLAAAASAFIDLISMLFKRTVLNIVRHVIAAEGHVSLSLKTADMTRQVALPNDVTLAVKLTAAPGRGLTPFGKTQLKQALNVEIS